MVLEEKKSFSIPIPVLSIATPLITYPMDLLQIDELLHKFFYFDCIVYYTQYTNK